MRNTRIVTVRLGKTGGRAVSQAQTSHIERLETALQRLGRILASRNGGSPGLSPSQRIAMVALQQGPLQVSEVAGVLGVTLSAATGLVDRLVRYKLASRERDLHDRRVVWVRMTDEGTRVLTATELRRVAVLTEILSPLSGPEVADLCNSLDRLTANL